MSYYSINKFTGDGSKLTWDINFVGGFIDRSDVQAYEYSVDGTTFTNRTLQIEWVSDTQITLSPAVKAGALLVIKRDTHKSAPVVDYTGNSVLTEKNLDSSVNQLLFSVQEINDRLDDTANTVDSANGAVLDLQNIIDAIYADRDLINQLVLQTNVLKTRLDAYLTALAGGAIGSTAPSVTVTVSTVSYTLTASANGMMVLMDNALQNYVIVPKQSSVALPVGTQVAIVQQGSGLTTIQADVGVTVRNPYSLNLNKQYSIVSLVKVASDIWELTGDVQSLAVSKVTSVNGQVGDVVIAAGGGSSPVHSVNGQIGDVVLATGVSSVNGKTGDVVVQATVPNTIGAVGTYSFLAIPTTNTVSEGVTYTKIALPKRGDDLPGNVLWSYLPPNGNFNKINVHTFNMQGTWRCLATPSDMGFGSDGRANGSQYFFLRIA